ncbi:FHA domain-containing protein [Myceligenerans pegani]|uniref:FHA domain-containing protein n=1 Tax=Myceligenerans pegani TaxID=2776917 RepID=A0ABR9N1Z9_9MICO|nr:FHA domain-containing protein [Myceligenerans sp. TRM 65318]MBE1877668.1 FHA domain-containing protein [Myceligenerans sp. TRM 65318]MBE3019939.1 FHA domain-containing protein [Myceligenerans sp. TRM 65318]
MTTTQHDSKLEKLPPTQASLAHGVADRDPGTLYVLSFGGGVKHPPQPGVEVTFGREKPAVQVLVGGDDRSVSRRHGVLRYDDGAWWLRNSGRRNLQLPGTTQLFHESAPYPLTPGYTPVFIRTSASRTHLVEIYVSDGTGNGPRPVYGEPTFDGQTWALSPAEKLAVVATAQPYLLYERHPEPWSREAVAALLRDVDRGERWSKSKVGRIVDGVRERLSSKGVPGLTAAEVGSPVGNRLKHNLVVELMASRTIVPPDLDLLDANR